MRDAVAARMAPGHSRATAPNLTERRLLASYHRHRDTASREQLVQRFLPLARQLARRYQGRGQPLDDLEQVASIGLLKAIERFDPCRAVRFSSFAVPTILGELRRFFRDLGWAVRVPRDLQETALKVERLSDELSSELGRAATPTELAERLGTSVEKVLAAREAYGAYRIASLDEPRTDDGGDASYIDTLGAPDPGFDRADQAATLAVLMRVLGSREREVVRLRFQEDLTQSQIGARLGISQMHVSRLLRRSFVRLREYGEQGG